MKEISKIFKALSDPNRLRILKMLEYKPLCVCEITEILQLAPSTVSKHLGILRDSGFITDTKEGKWVNYQSDYSEKIAAVFPVISDWLNADVQIQKDQKIVNSVDRNIICNTENTGN